MRLFEIQGQLRGNFRKSEIATLMTILNHLDSKIANGTQVPFDSIAELMHNVGYNFTFNDFMELYHQAPAIKNLVTGTPTEQGLTLGRLTPADQDDQQKQNRVDQMAKTATNANM